MRILVLAITLLMTACTTNYISNFYGGDTDVGSGDTVVPADTDETGDDSDAPLDTDFAPYGEAVVVVNFIGPSGQSSPPYVDSGDFVWMGRISLEAFGGRIPIQGLTLVNETKQNWMYWTPFYQVYDMPPYFETCKLFDDMTGQVVAEAVPTGDSLTYVFNTVLENADYREFQNWCTVQSNWSWSDRTSAAFFLNPNYGALQTDALVIVGYGNEPGTTQPPEHFVRLPSTKFEKGDTGSPGKGDTDTGDTGSPSADTDLVP